MALLQCDHLENSVTLAWRFSKWSPSL